MGELPDYSYDPCLRLPGSPCLPSQCVGSFSQLQALTVDPHGSEDYPPIPSTPTEREAQSDFNEPLKPKLSCYTVV